MTDPTRFWKTLAATMVVGLALGAASATTSSQSVSWRVAADVAESCSCDVTCPCNFGSSPTHDYCHGNRLYEVSAGHYGDTDVTGLKFLVTFSMGEWAKLYVSDEATDAQMDALEGLVPHVLGGFESWGILSTQKVPLQVERSSTKVKYSVPESVVEMDVMTGFGGEPVRVEHLPSPTMQSYTQYKSVEISHRGGDHEFSYSGTTGFTSKLDARSEE